MMTVREVAKLARVSEISIYRAARENRIPGAVRVGKALRFNEAAIREWLAGTPLEAR